MYTPWHFSFRSRLSKQKNVSRKNESADANVVIMRISSVNQQNHILVVYIALSITYMLGKPFVGLHLLECYHLPLRFGYFSMLTAIKYILKLNRFTIITI